jgi:hypothetical protein
MNRYKCPECKGNQYSSSSEKENEPCIYCGNSTVKFMLTIDEKDGEDDGEDDENGTGHDEGRF